LFDSAKQGTASPDQGDDLMLKEVLAQQTLIVSKLHVTEAEPISLSKSKGKDSTHDDMMIPGKWSNRSGQEPN
jgi:hypothetical protein